MVFEEINLQNNFGFKHEMSKIMSVLPMQDVFYGLIFEDSSDFFILSINPSLCKICQVQDGVFNFKMRLSGINPLHIGSYPDCVKQAYLDYRNGDSYFDGWFVPQADKQMCFKFNENTITPMPFLLGLIKDILDLDTYKKLQSFQIQNTHSHMRLEVSFAFPHYPIRFP